MLFSIALISLPTFNLIEQISNQELYIDYENENPEDIVKKIEYAIEQHPSFLKVISKEELKRNNELNKKREW